MPSEGTPAGGGTAGAAPLILCVVHEAGEFVELSRVAEVAKKRGFRIAFLFASPHYPNLGKDRAICRFKGFDAYFPGRDVELSPSIARNLRREARLEQGYMPHSLVAPATVPRAGSRWKRLVSVAALGTFFLASRLSLAARFARARRERDLSGYFAENRYARSVYEHLRPRLLIFGQEFPGSINTGLTRLAARDGASTLIVPFAMGTTKEMVESLHDKPLYEVSAGLLNRIAATLYPHWINYYKGKELLRLPGSSVLLLEVTGLAPEHPWIPNNSKVDGIAVESPEMMDYYTRMQFPARQLRLTGAMVDDLLFAGRQRAQQTRKMLERDLGLNPGRKLLVCAWPTNQFGSRFVPLEFSSYEALCNAWAAALGRVLSDGAYDVVICPHPVTPRELLEAVLGPHKLDKRVYNGGTLSVVPCADLFVACVSSTIRWAIASGVPVINYDCYDYGYTDFDPAPGVRTVRAFADFDRQLLEWTETPTALDAVREAQRACAPRWGFHDGQSAQRLMALVEELAAAGAPQPAHEARLANEPA